MSVHFSIDELTHSDTAVRLGIDNTATYEIANNLELLANNLELVRAELGYPLRINSAYRCEALNKAIGGAAKSDHIDGYAADFTCAEFGTPVEIVKRIESSAINFHQLIQEGKWVHISFAPGMKREILTAHFNNGVATYTVGA